MSLVVSPSPSVAAVPAAASASMSGPHLKWLWAAIGVLGVSVVALGTTLVVQNRNPSAATAPVVAAAPAPVAASLENPASNMPSPQSGQRNVAMNNAANMPHAALAPQGVAQGPGPSYEPAAPALRTAAPVPRCATCGRVESVQAVQQAAPATGVGAVAGGVLGAVVGNQVGKGSGRTAATVLGAVGGGYVGHKVEERTRTQTVYQVAVRMEDGSVRRFTRSQPPAVGTPVVLQGKGFRVDDGAAARTAEPYPPRAQPGAVRVADTY